MIGSALWGFGLLIHISLIIFAIFFIFENPKFSSDISKQALKTIETIKQLENDDWIEIPLKAKSKKFDPDEYLSKKNKHENIQNSIDLSLYYKDTEFNKFSSVQIKEFLELSTLTEDKKSIVKIYEPILKQECPDCHLWISEYSLNDASSDYSLKALKENLQVMSKLGEGRLSLWIAFGRLAQIILTALLLTLIFYFWKSKKNGFLDWLEKFLFVFSPILLMLYLAAATTTSIDNYKYSDGMPYFTGINSDFYLKILIIGFIGLFVLTPVAFTIRKSRLSKL